MNNMKNEKRQTTVTLVTFGKQVSLAGAVPRTLSGSEAGRVIGWGCGGCSGNK